VAVRVGARRKQGVAIERQMAELQQDRILAAILMPGTYGRWSFSALANPQHEWKTFLPEWSFFAVIAYASGHLSLSVDRPLCRCMDGH
jgi:hypothetical protein